MGSLITPKTWPLAMPMTAGLAQPGGLGLPDPDLLFDYRWPHGLPAGTTASNTDPATQIDADGVLRLYDPDVPRLSNGWQIEGAGQNQIRNPYAEGATAGVIGAGGANPTNWSVGASGLTIDVIGTGVDGNNITYIEYELDGTTASTNGQVRFEPNDQIGAVQDDDVAISAYLAHVSGSLDNVTAVTIKSDEYNGDVTPAFLSGNSSSDIKALLTSTLQRFDFITQMDEAAAAYSRPLVQLAWGNGVVIDALRLRVGVPQWVNAPFASSLILPAVSNPAASDRAADVAYADLGAGNLNGVFSAEALVERSHVANAVSPLILQFNNSTSTISDRAELFVGSGNNGFNVTTYSSSTQRGQANSGVTAVADTLHRARIVIDVPNAVQAINVDGNGWVTATDASFPTDLRYLHIGMGANVSRYWNGSFRAIRVWQGDRWGAL